MFDEIIGIVLCFGFFFVLIPFIVAIILFQRLADHTRQLKTLETRVQALWHELTRRQQTPAAPSPATPPEPTPQPTTPPTATQPPSAMETLLARQAALRHDQKPLPPQTTPTTTAPPPIPTPPAPQAPAAPAPPPPPTPTAPPKPPPRKLNYEALIGVKLFVALGAIVLGFASIFLVKVGIDRGWFRPELRVYAGIFGGLFLLALAQWRRKHESFLAQGLSAAGIVALFAAFYAATMSFGMLSRPQGFLLLGATTAIAVLLSLQRPGGGPLLATLGLIGGFITPILVRTDVPNVPGLFGYLILLHTGLIIVTRMRGWSILAAISVLLSSAWLIGFLLLTEWKPHDGPILGAFMLATTIAMVIGTVTDPSRWGRHIGAIFLTWLAGVSGLVAASLLVQVSGFTDLEWAYFATLLAGAFVLARLRREYEGLTWLCAFAVLVTLLTWAGWEHRHLPPEQLPRLRNWIIGLGTGSVLAAYICQWKSTLPVRWTLLTNLLALSYVGAAYGVLGVSPRADQWAWLPLIAAAILSAAAIPFFLRRTTITGGEDVLAVYAHVILAMLLIAPPMAWTEAPLTAAWTPLLPLTALAIWRLKLPSLLLGFLIVLALLTIRGITFGHVLNANQAGMALWWNPVLWAYGSLFLAGAISTWLIDRVSNAQTVCHTQGSGPLSMFGKTDSPNTTDPPGAQPTPEELQNRKSKIKNKKSPQFTPSLPPPQSISTLLQVFTTLAAFALITGEIRWYFQSGNLDQFSLQFAERGTYASLWLLFCCALLWLGQKLHRPALARCAEVLGILALAYIAAIPLTLGNPMLWNDTIHGTVLFNSLLYVYALPAALAIAFARMLPKESFGIKQAATVIVTILLFILTALEVRHGFHTDDLRSFDFTFTEQGTYSAAWLAVGIIALWAGVRWHRTTLHFVGIIFCAIAIGFALFISGIPLNPILTHKPIPGILILNALLYTYALPALAAAILANFLLRRALWERQLGFAFAVAALLLTFILISLQVQHAFRGEILGTGHTASGEMAAYSFAWAAYGAALLAAGIWRNNLLLRWASLILMLGTVVKVFAWDFTANTDLERVASFTGLGLTLMALAFIYHRFVFRKSATPPNN